MRFMIIRKADKNTEAGKMPSQALMRAMGEYNDKMVKAGVMLAGEGLKPSSAGTRIKFENGKVKSVLDGPFAETKELVAGFSIINVKSKAEALEWLKKWPREDGDVELELRPLFEEEDFGEAFTPELRAQEERQRAEIAARR